MSVQQSIIPDELAEVAYTDLQSRLRGELIQPGDATYDAARRVYNGMIDKHPAAIARCVDVADVIAAVNVAREHGITPAIRGGGHFGGGLGACSDGFVWVTGSTVPSGTMAAASAPAKTGWCSTSHR